MSVTVHLSNGSVLTVPGGSRIDTDPHATTLIVLGDDDKRLGIFPLSSIDGATVDPPAAATGNGTQPAAAAAGRSRRA